MTPQRGRQWNTDEVNGIAVGDITCPYEFWIEEKRREYQHVEGVPTRRVDRGFFKNDEAAISWFKENYCAEWAQGVQNS